MRQSTGSGGLSVSVWRHEPTASYGGPALITATYDGFAAGIAFIPLDDVLPGRTWANITHDEAKELAMEARSSSLVSSCSFSRCRNLWSRYRSSIVAR